MCRRSDQDFLPKDFSDRGGIKGLGSQMHSVGAGANGNISAIVDQQARISSSCELAGPLNQLEQNTRGQLLFANLD